jgi:HPt (histidine-containing phosphotransfer) domain-containing protein
MNNMRLPDSCDRTPGQDRLELPAPSPQLDIARGVDLMGSEEALADILDTVITSLMDAVPDIRNALKADDVPLANGLLHGIKGYSPIFCTDALTAQIAQVELISKTGSRAAVQPLFAKLAPRLEALLVEIQTYRALGK